MNIELTKKEYRDLLDLLYMGQWLLEAHDDIQDPSKQKYDDVIQKIYAHAKSAGYDNLIVFDKELKKYFPTRTYEDTSMCRVHIDEYDDETLWDELVRRLADRDIQRLISRNEIKKPTSMEEKIKTAHPIETKYLDEFEKNGLENVVVQTEHGRGTIH